MNMENHQQSPFKHEEWITRLFQFIETARQFSNAFAQAAKTAKPVPKKSVKMASTGGKINKSKFGNSGLFGRK